MCLILVKPKNAKNHLTYDRFENALLNNPHSVGIVYTNEDGDLEIVRFVNPTENSREIYKFIENKDQYAIHFRYATHGEIDLDNCHPFVVTNELVLMHNGVMSDFGKVDEGKSDTRNFTETFLRPYIEEVGVGIINDKDFIADMEKIIGSYNKLLLIDKDFNFSIINEKAGVWRDGCWLSNSYSTEDYKSYYSSYYKNPSQAYDSKDDFNYNKSYNSFTDPYTSDDPYTDNKTTVEEIMGKLVNTNDNDEVNKLMEDPFGYVDVESKKYYTND